MESSLICIKNDYISSSMNNDRSRKCAFCRHPFDVQPLTIPTEPGSLMISKASMYSIKVLQILSVVKRCFSLKQISNYSNHSGRLKRHI